MNEMNMCEYNMPVAPQKETITTKMNAALHLLGEIYNSVNALNEILYGCGQSKGRTNDEPVSVEAKLDFICGELNEIYNGIQTILNRMV